MNCIGMLSVVNQNTDSTSEHFHGLIRFGPDLLSRGSTKSYWVTLKECRLITILMIKSVS